MCWALWGEWLTVRWILILIAIEFCVAAVVTSIRLHFPLIADETDSLKEVATEFWRYCLPLIPYAWFNFAYVFTDRWLLQNYSGSVQQAYYSVAEQFGAIATLATASILNIFWKEIAEAHQHNNHERVALLYRRVSRGLFFVAAVVAGFLAPWADDILYISFGPAYIGGAATLMIMFFYPLHQSMGQIGATMAFATGHVAAYVKMGMATMTLSIIVTYFVLASTEAPLPGLELGSMGLAGKMVMIQIISVNALAFYLSRSLGVQFDWMFQPVATLLCMGAGLLAYSLSHALLVNGTVFVQFATAGIIYILLTALSLYALPWLVGITRNELVSLVRYPLIRANQ
jgi:O-antigen/teichoic acid export membrane protein